MPHTVDVRCPACASLATFEFAEVVWINRSKDIEFFKRCKTFEYRFVEDHSGQRWHVAIFFHGLKGQTLSSIKDLPDGYAPELWSHSRHLIRNHGWDIGVVVCASCDLRRKHALVWPDEAFFQVEHKGHVLWAFNSESARELLEYVDSVDRDIDGYRWRFFLRHVPSRFLHKSARGPVSKKLQRLLPPEASAL